MRLAMLLPFAIIDAITPLIYAVIHYVAIVDCRLFSRRRGCRLFADAAIDKMPRYSLMLPPPLRYITPLSPPCRFSGISLRHCFSFNIYAHYSCCFVFAAIFRLRHLRFHCRPRH